mmetsp:Transcript_5116/g.7533  ORF Transcript_5116/g.7533 Transcript_5116/m.7533 type:complete len:218 (-) Transcript_5116:246-899(-)|eukprot:CAMPEP_0172422104 /NCGR_PEP_ID=MMETSP1064-20121228/8286_1 /TAXON_ID=202472 /ORGANISM="Aulacoseira subarctica , Strain CCAP 1002/5" /LENGTH=217 /DNA_ID=CAMNT_0013162809 /DNA_START=95 /DNA_END=748 /DNA_ORIENTATION=+
MVKLLLLATLATSSVAFAPQTSFGRTTALNFGNDPTGSFELGGGYWDPMGLSKLGANIDTFPAMFPHKQYMEAAEIKNGRMAMLAWTGIWATTQGGLGLGLHFPGAPVEPDWTKALGVFFAEQPYVAGAILAFIALAEGESVGHSGDNFRGKSTKEDPGFLGLDPLGFRKKLSPEKLARYKIVELKNGRAAMIAMASLFAFKSIPGSVPIMDILGAQ